MKNAHVAALSKLFTTVKYSAGLEHGWRFNTIPAIEPNTPPSRMT
jgi:hypothetical protein